MQDTSTGELKPIDFANWKEFQYVEKLSDEIKRQTGIPTEFQGPIFKVGETLEIKGGKFRVERIQKFHLILKSIASV